MLTRLHHPPDETPTLPHLLCPHHSLCPPDTAYHPYACGVPSQHAPNTTDPYACVVPSRHAPDTAYHPYTRKVPSRHCLPSLRSQSALPHDPNTAYHPYTRGVPSHMLPTLLTILTLAEYPPTCSQHCLLSLRWQSTLPHAPDTAYHLSACGVHSQHAPETTYPYTCVVPS
ncbi:hypothetical protein O181_126916 [Austropuccinia psidii MF-1]|uniref:Uncharacterized protein n=1 Tax=Austropuccinia psidii MF-1 TaxID=1389203 RepID=A0A9Q3KVZ9_9BASI|nr:hypothetical protein [Austropuccinia psidii MF-1]